MAQQLRTLVGGRLSENLIEGPLALHLPNPMEQDLSGQFERLVVMRKTLPLILKDVYNMQAQMGGPSDDEQANQAIADEIGKRDAAGAYGKWGNFPANDPKSIPGLVQTYRERPETQPGVGAPAATPAAPAGTPSTGAKKFWE